MYITSQLLRSGVKIQEINRVAFYETTKHGKGKKERVRRGGWLMNLVDA